MSKRSVFTLENLKSNIMECIFQWVIYWSQNGALRHTWKYHFPWADPRVNFSSLFAFSEVTINEIYQLFFRFMCIEFFCCVLKHFLNPQWHVENIVWNRLDRFDYTLVTHKLSLEQANYLLGDNLCQFYHRFYG